MGDALDDLQKSFLFPSHFLDPKLDVTVLAQPIQELPDRQHPIIGPDADLGIEQEFTVLADGSIKQVGVAALGAYFRVEHAAVFSRREAQFLKILVLHVLGSKVQVGFQHVTVRAPTENLLGPVRGKFAIDNGMGRP